ncbi:MAG: DMT family transporter [Ruminococcus sp.]|jgi:drug/metabolite transporter (DMT)-like permease
MKKIIIIAGVVGTAFSAILVRFADAPSTVLVFYRMLFSVLMLSPLAAVRHRTEFSNICLRDVGLCAVSGIFLGMHFFCYFQSLQYTSIASSVVLVDTEVFFVALGGFFFLKEKVSGPGWAGILITFAGSVIVAFGDAGGGRILGDILALCGAVCSAVYTLIGRVCRRSMSTTVYTWIVYFCAGAVILPAAVFTGSQVVPCSVRNLAVAFGLAVLCTLLGHSIFSWGLKYEKSSFVSIVKLLEPVFASVMGILLFQEIPSFSSVIGGIVVIAGIVLCILANREEPGCS